MDLEQRLGKTVHFISFPFSRYNETIVNVCLDAGYLKGCAFWLTQSERKKETPFVLRTKAYYLFDTIWNLKSKINQTFWSPVEDIKLRTVNFLSHGTAIVKSY